VSKDGALMESPFVTMGCSMPCAFRRAKGGDTFGDHFYRRRLRIHLASFILLFIPVLLTARRNRPHEGDRWGERLRPGEGRAKLEVRWGREHRGKEEEHSATIALVSPWPNRSAGKLWQPLTARERREAVAYVSDNIEYRGRVSLEQLIIRYFRACWRRRADIER